MHTVKLPYGLKEDELVHVKAVARGDACGCICPKCEGSLRAAKGEHNIEHFRHVDASECEGAAEFALRQKLMQLFEEAGKITLPESRVKIDGESRVLAERETVEIESICAASSNDPLMPRFVIRTRSSHEEERQITAVVNLGTRDPELEDSDDPIVEIKLADLGDDFSVERLIRAVISDTRCIHWARRPRAKERENELREELRVIRTTESDKERLLRLARKSQPSSLPIGSSVDRSSYFGSAGELSEPILSNGRSFALQFDGIKFTCDECGESGFSHEDMQRFCPDLGTGVCYACKGVRRKNAHERNDYSAEFKAKAATFYQLKGAT